MSQLAFWGGMGLDERKRRYLKTAVVHFLLREQFNALLTLSPTQFMTIFFLFFFSFFFHWVVPNGSKEDPFNCSALPMYLTLVEVGAQHLSVICEHWGAWLLPVSYSSSSPCSAQQLWELCCYPSEGRKPRECVCFLLPFLSVVTLGF